VFKRLRLGTITVTKKMATPQRVAIFFADAFAFRYDTSGPAPCAMSPTPHQPMQSSHALQAGMSRYV
jgi:hypothetical protein